MPTTPVIPQFITVHLGAPDEEALNVTVPFMDYVKNVASSEIYPTWPENSIRANIYAQISFALNRIYTEFYRSRGYDFDITNSTAFDQFFVDERNIFENISQTVSEIFDSYIRRQGFIEPLFAQYCNGTTVTCNGLSQWGTVDLANQGLTPYEILQFYYGNNIDIVTDVPVQNVTASLPPNPLRIGSVGDDVRQIQIRLNRISDNYPSIPKIYPTDGIFTTDTFNAVTTFQQIFNLTPDGVVGRATWYSIQMIYNAVKRLNEINSEGLRLDEISKQFPSVLSLGSRGAGVQTLQYFLTYLSNYYNSIPPVAIDGVFGESTRAAVIDLQNTFGLTPDGIVGANTWDTMYNAYVDIVSTIPLKYVEGNIVPFQGNILRIGSESDEVRLLQEYLNYIANVYTEIPQVNVTGFFGTRTQEAVIVFQRLFGLEQNGLVGSVTWNAITDVYSDIFNGSRLNEGQHPGYEIGA